MITDVLVYDTRDGKVRMRFKYKSFYGKEETWYSDAVEPEELLMQFNEGLCVVEQMGE